MIEAGMGWDGLGWVEQTCNFGTVAWWLALGFGSFDEREIPYL